MDGQEFAAFPPPVSLLEAGGLGLPAQKQEWLRGLARAVLDGVLTTEHLRSLGPEGALAELRAMPGAGPFSAGLILIRGRARRTRSLATSRGCSGSCAKRTGCRRTRTGGWPTHGGRTAPGPRSSSGPPRTACWTIGTDRGKLRRAARVRTCMENRFADVAVIRRLLSQAQTWAFVGLRDNPDRTAYDQARLLQSRGRRIIPVHPNAETVLGERGYRSLAEVPDSVDIVAVYRRSRDAGESVDDAIAAGVKAVWLPLGVIDEAAAQRALDAGLDVVMDRCPGVEWALRRAS